MAEREPDPIDALVQGFPGIFRGERPRVWSDLPAGWLGLATDLFKDLDAMLAQSPGHGRFAIEQIKEKFGRLRVYWKLACEGTVDLTVHEETPSRFRTTPRQPSELFMAIRKRVDEAELASASICQRCGATPARALETGWLVTLCDACRSQSEKTS